MRYLLFCSRCSQLEDFSDLDGKNTAGGGIALLSEYLINIRRKAIMIWFSAPSPSRSRSVYWIYRFLSWSFFLPCHRKSVFLWPRCVAECMKSIHAICTEPEEGWQCFLTRLFPYLIYERHLHRKVLFKEQDTFPTLLHPSGWLCFV